ncbi:cellulose binding domain-containing protein [Glycomyces paridis]|uniref:CBM2 domain-containing protein n=1 Tax=Glycomyces paridis TaxID=2126555 RepID=A0A4S8P0P9_9ACTN|nr:cellulose binding domain-containing protein [Glycomyces paridis]THV23567.1 hypothetical protein E9998_22490 [Glycomyces paridis]
MRPWMERATLRGRIHGRLLLVLIVIAALACIAAVLQFSVLRDGDDTDRTNIGADAPSAPDFSAAPDTSVESTSATPSPDVETSSSSPEPEPTKSASAAEPTEAAPPASQCSASLALDNEWGDSVAVTVTVANTGTEPIDGWEVELAVEHLSVASTWGLDHVEGDRYGDVWLNGAVEPGSSVEPSFTADVEGEYDLPETVPCTPVE